MNYDLTSPGSTPSSWNYLPSLLSNMQLWDWAPQSFMNSLMTSLDTGRLQASYRGTASDDNNATIHLFLSLNMGLEGSNAYMYLYRAQLITFNLQGLLYILYKNTFTADEEMIYFRGSSSL